MDLSLQKENDRQFYLDGIGWRDGSHTKLSELIISLPDPVFTNTGSRADRTRMQADTPSTFTNAHDHVLHI